MLQVLALLLALGTIVYMVKKKYALYQAMALGILILVVSMEKSFVTVLTLLGEALSKRTTIELVLAVGLISLLSRLLKDLGLLENFMKALVAFVRSTKLALIIIPALIGLFPIIGGAIFSAPLVDTLGDRLRLSANIKTSANLIFRHAVFYFSPFNPSLILLAGITGIEILEMIKYLFPLGVANIVVGYILYLHRAEDVVKSEPEERMVCWTGQLKMLLMYGAPLFLSLLLFIFFRVPLLVSLVIGVVAALLLGDRKKGNFKVIFTRGPDPLLMLGIAGIMVFQSLVGELEGLFVIMETIAASGIPNFFLFVIIPFLIGWISASFSLTVGITAPLLFPLLQQGGGEVFYAILLYASGFFSYYISPIHLCQIVSNNYFKVRGFDAYRIQYPVLFAAFVLSLIIFSLGIYII